METPKDRVNKRIIACDRKSNRIANVFFSLLKARFKLSERDFEPSRISFLIAKDVFH